MAGPAFAPLTARMRHGIGGREFVAVLAMRFGGVPGLYAKAILNRIGLRGDGA